MNRKCLDCGEPIFGRVDKKFCSDLCRNNYNNRQNSELSATMREVNTILRKNRRILSELNPGDKVTLHKDKLANIGFNFTYFTNTYVTQKGHIYYFVYEYGYLPLENNFYMIVVRDQKERNKN